MTVDKQKLKALAEAADQQLMWGYAVPDSLCINPHVSAILVGPRRMDMDRMVAYQIDDAKFIAAASPTTVLALLAEIERLEGRKRLCPHHERETCLQCAWPPREQSEIDQLKAENEELRKDAERYRYMRRVWAPHLSQDEADAQTDAAMAKEKLQ